MEFAAHSFAGKKIGVFGLARSGLATIAALCHGGAQVLAWDDASDSVEKCRADNLPVRDLREVDFATLDALVLSPGVPLTHPAPHWTVEKANAAGIEIIGDTEIFARELAIKGGRMVAITGTNGKSTTTALIGHILAAAGRDVHVGGNIGRAVFLLPPPQPERIYVLELSSYQIDLMPSLKPAAGILMNLSPDHLDRHGSMEHYAAVKARMFARQDSDDVAIISLDDRYCAAIAKAITGTQLLPISVLSRLEDGISAVDCDLQERRAGEPVAEINLDGLLGLRGRHNRQNACAAYGAAVAMGLTTPEISAGFASFPGLAHRMEEIARLDNVIFVNDSKATNVDAAARALDSFGDIYWIAGGRAKDGGIEALSEYFGKLRHAYLIGEAATNFAASLAGKCPVTICDTIEKAVTTAAFDAHRQKSGEPVVLLSPACASFDQYRNFELRGEAYRSAVAALPDIELNQMGDATC